MQIAIFPTDLFAANEAAEAARSEAANDAAAAQDIDHQQYWIDNADARAQVGAAAAQLAFDTPQAVANARAQTGPGAIGLTGLALDNFDRDFQSRSETLPEAARPAFARLVAPYRDHLGASAINTEAADRLAWRAGTYTQSADQWGDAVARSPALLPAASAALRDTLPHLDAAQTGTLAEYARNKLVQGGIAGALAQDPAGLHEALTRAADDEDGTPDHPLIALMTTPERTHYLEAARIGVLAQQTMEREQTRSLAAQAGPQLLATGQAENVPSRAQLVAHLGEEEGTRVADSLQMDAATGSARRLIAPLSEGEFARLQAQPAAPGEQGARDREAMERAINLERQNRAADPMGYAQKSGLYGVTPITDFNDAPALAAELNRRRLANVGIAQDYGIIPPSLSKDENIRLAQTLDMLPPDGQYALLQQLHQGLGNPDLSQVAMRDLSSSAPVLAVAGSNLAQLLTDEESGSSFGGDGKISASRLALQGNAVLHPPEGKLPPAMPPETETRAAFARLIGDRYMQAPGAEEARYQTALSTYVALRGMGSDPTLLDPALWHAAAKLAIDGDGTARELGLVSESPPRDKSPSPVLPISRRIDKRPDKSQGNSSEDQAPTSNPLDPTASGRDKPNAFVDHTKDAIANPPSGTSNQAVSELPKRYPGAFDHLKKLGPGSTIFGGDKAGDGNANSFTIPSLPEESTTDPRGLTYHKYGVLTYLGPADPSKGITKDTVVDLLVDRYSRPGYLLKPSAPDFAGRTSAYALGPVGAVIDDKNLDDPKYYTDKIGSIAQVRVPDGVVNITDTDHKVYPGTIRRQIIEVDGHLFVYTQGSGENRFENSPLVGATSSLPPPAQGAEAAVKSGTRLAAAFGNDRFGPRAFKTLDSQLYQDVVRVRNGEKLEAATDAHLNPDDLLPSTLPPAIFTNNPRRGTDF